MIKPNLSELRVLVAEGLAAGYAVENVKHINSILDGSQCQTVDGEEESKSGSGDGESVVSVMFLNDVYTLARALLQIMDGSYTTVNDKMHHVYHDSSYSHGIEEKKQCRRDVVITLGHRGVVWCTSEEHSEEHTEEHSKEHSKEYSVELEKTHSDQILSDSSGSSYLKTKCRGKSDRGGCMYTYTYTYTHTPAVPLGIHSSGTFNTNGAGDTFCSGLIHHIVQHNKENDCNNNEMNNNKSSKNKNNNIYKNYNNSRKSLKISQFSIDAGLHQAYMKIISSATPPPSV
jgi:hypothetical protein